jgi:uncharacterized protein YPO0396
MKLKLINFHYFVNQTIEFDGLPTVITGDTGAGKSTIIDALQIIFLGDQRKIKFNTSAHEHKTERTLLSYLRGKIGTVEKEFLRNKDFSSYIVMEIAHQTNKGDIPYLVGAVFDYQHSTQSESHTFFNVTGKSLNDSLFLNGTHPKIREDFFRDLKKENITHKTYPNDLVGYKNDLKTILGNVKDSFFSLLPKGIAFSPITNLRKFVYDYILDEEPVDVDRMRDFMERMDELDTLIGRAEREIIDLTKIDHQHESLRKKDNELLLNEYFSKRFDVENTKIQLENKRSTIQTDSVHFSNIENIITDLKAVHTQLEADIDELNQNIGSHQNSIKEKEIQIDMNNLKDKIEEIDLALESLKANVKKDIRELIRFEQLLKQFNAPISFSHDILSAKYCFEQFVDSSINAFPKNYSELANVWNQSFHWLQQFSFGLENEQSINKTKLSELQDIIQQLGKNQILPEHSPSMKLKRILQEHIIPSDNVPLSVNILCEIIDVPNDTWRNAVEGYLHTQKFDILVTPEYFDQAADIYERFKYTQNIERVGLVNTEKLLSDNPSAQSGSLAVEVQCNIDFGKAYVNRLMGSIIKVDSITNLKKYLRSITSSCATYMNYAIRQIPKDRYDTPFIGRNAIDAQMKLKKAEQSSLEHQFAQISSQLEELEIIRDFSSNKSDKYQEWNKVSLTNLHLDKFYSQLEELNRDLLALDMSEVKEFEQQVKDTRKTAKETNDEIHKKSEEKGRIEKRLSDDQLLLIDYKNKLASFTSELFSFTKQFKDTTDSELDQIWEEELTNHPLSYIKLNADSKRKDIQFARNEIWEDLILKRQSYTTVFEISYDAKAHSNSEYSSRLSFLVSEKIVDYKEKAAEAREMAHQSFKEDFIAKLKEQIERAEEDFNALNRSLKDMEFGTDRYRFKVDSRKDNNISKYYKMLTDPNLIGSSMFSLPFQNEYEEIINNLFESVVRSREVQDYNELLDYRSYLEYELCVTDSQGNTIEYSKVALEKSGGETQVPFYVAILASFYHTYQLYRKSDTFRLVILDEAFNRMDADRVAEAIRFIKSCGFQPIIVTPTGSAYMYTPHMSNTAIVLKENYYSFIAPFSSNEIEEYLSHNAEESDVD